MPVNANLERRDWSPKADFGRPMNVVHFRPRPTSVEHLANLLDDMSIIPEAEVYRTLDDELVREILEGAAEEIYPHVRADRPEYYTIEEVVHRNELREQLGATAFGVTIYPDGNRVTHAS